MKFGQFFENIKLDIGYALGRIIAQPKTSLIIIFTFALSIGATTAIFSIVNGLMFQATPFKDSDKLVILQQQDINSEQSFGFSASELEDFQNQSTTLEEIAEYHNMTFTMYGHEEPVRVRTGIVSSNFFQLLNLTPILGRTFTEAEDDIGAEPLLLLTYEFWQQQFSGSDDVINQTVEFNNRSHKIIGVLPHFPQFPNVNDIYMTIPSCPWRSSENALSNRQMRMMTSFGKMKETADLVTTSNEMASIADHLLASYPEAYRDNADISAQALSLHEELVRSSRPYLYTLLATTILLFLIATANVTNLTLSLHAKRKREFAVRSSLGASKARIAQLLLTESILLSLTGGLLGLLFAFFGLDALKDFASQFSSLASEITIDLNVMLFSLVISIIAGIIAGLAPNFSKINLVTALKEGGKSSYSTNHGWLRNALLVCQFALSLTLLITAGLTIKSLQNLQNIDTGFNTENVEIAQLDLNWSTYQDNQQRWQISQQILQQVRNLHYVDSAALAMTYPSDTVAVNFRQLRQALRLDDRDFDRQDILPNAFIRPVSDGYFETMSGQIISGRSFDQNDDDQSPAVVIINQSLAQKWWPNESAIDHRISLDNGENWYTIVGVSKNMLEHSNVETTRLEIYLPFAQSPMNHIAVISKLTNGVKLTGKNFVSDFKNIVKSLDNRQPFSKFESLQQAVDNAISLQRFLAQLLTLFAVIALLITISGVSGVISYMVTIRTREIGIRMAIGANKASIIMLIISHGLKLVVAGLSLGLGAAFISGNYLQSQLYQIQAVELSIYLATTLVLLTIAVIACLFPAWRASIIAPIQALKTN